MSWLNFLKAPTPSTHVTDVNTIDQQYRYWRIRILYSMYAGYAFFYFTRKSFYKGKGVELILKLASKFKRITTNKRGW